MTPDKIKEKIGLLKLYLTLLLASSITMVVWVAQNMDGVSKNSFITVGLLLLAFLIFSIILEVRIRKLINVL